MLTLIFFIVLFFRLYFAFQSPYFTNDSYFNLREISSIKQNFVPFFYDSLNEKGVVFVPGFHYLMALFSFFLPGSIALKVLPNVFASLLVFVVYLICFELTGDRSASLLSSFVSGFVPVFVYKTVNSVSPYSIVVPLMFLALYSFMRVNEKSYLYSFIVLLFALSLLGPSVLLLVLGLLFYFLLASVELVRRRRAELELLLFSLLLSLWVLLLFFKKAFLVHGSAVVWQNLPSAVLSGYFSGFNVLEAVYKIGLLPFFFGVYTLYLYLFKERSRDAYLFIGFGLTVLVLLLLKLVAIDAGLMFLGILLCVLFAPFYKVAVGYLKKMRFYSYTNWLAVFFAFVFLFTSVFSSVGYARKAVLETPWQEEYDALIWLKGNTVKDDVILSTPGEGFLVGFVSQRGTVIDTNYLLLRDASERFKDVKAIYTTPYETNALDLLNKYGVDYIVFSRNAVHEFSSSGLSYVSDSACFDTVYSKEVKIYRSRCVLK